MLVRLEGESLSIQQGKEVYDIHRCNNIDIKIQKLCNRMVSTSQEMVTDALQDRQKAWYHIGWQLKKLWMQMVHGTDYNELVQLGRERQKLLQVIQDQDNLIDSSSYVFVLLMKQSYGERAQITYDETRGPVGAEINLESLESALSGLQQKQVSHVKASRIIYQKHLQKIDDCKAKVVAVQSGLIKLREEMKTFRSLVEDYTFLLSNVELNLQNCERALMFFEDMKSLDEMTSGSWEDFDSYITSMGRALGDLQRFAKVDQKFERDFTKVTAEFLRLRRIGMKRVEGEVQERSRSAGMGLDYSRQRFNYWTGKANGNLSKALDVLDGIRVDGLRVDQQKAINEQRNKLRSRCTKYQGEAIPYLKNVLGMLEGWKNVQKGGEEGLRAFERLQTDSIAPRETYSMKDLRETGESCLHEARELVTLVSKLCEELPRRREIEDIKDFAAERILSSPAIDTTLEQREGLKQRLDRMRVIAEQIKGSRGSYIAPLLSVDEGGGDSIAFKADFQAIATMFSQVDVALESWQKGNSSLGEYNSGIQALLKLPILGEKDVVSARTLRDEIGLAAEDIGSVSVSADKQLATIERQMQLLEDKLKADLRETIQREQRMYRSAQSELNMMNDGIEDVKGGFSLFAKCLEIVPEEEREGLSALWGGISSVEGPVLLDITDDAGTTLEELSITETALREKVRYSQEVMRETSQRFAVVCEQVQQLYTSLMTIVGKQVDAFTKDFMSIGPEFKKMGFDLRTAQQYIKYLMDQTPEGVRPPRFLREASSKQTALEKRLGALREDLKRMAKRTKSFKVSLQKEQRRISFDSREEIEKGMKLVVYFDLLQEGLECLKRETLSSLSEEILADLCSTARTVVGNPDYGTDNEIYKSAEITLSRFGVVGAVSSAWKGVEEGYSVAQDVMAKGVGAVGDAVRFLWSS